MSSRKGWALDRRKNEVDTQGQMAAVTGGVPGKGRFDSLRSKAEMLSGVQLSECED